MNSKIKPLTRILLPVDMPESVSNTAPMVGAMVRLLDKKIENICILHVMEGRYLSKHMANIDFRANLILESELLKKLKKEYLEKEVGPRMEKIKSIFQQHGVHLPIDLMIETGYPVERISFIAKEGAYSTIIMQRRGLSRMKEFFLGSVSAGLLWRNIQSTIYLVGDIPLAPDKSPISRCLVAVDGSEYSARALQEAAILLSQKPDDIEKVILIHVLDISLIEATELDKSLVRDGTEYLNNAADILIKEGVGEDKIVKVALYGNPAEIIAEQADMRSATLVFMGRRGRTELTEILLGSVSSGVIHRCKHQTVALVSN